MFDFLSGDTAGMGNSIIGGNEVAGGGGGLSSLLTNKLFLQFLASGGKAISEGKPLASGIEPVISQVQASQNADKKYTALLKQLLGPDETKGTFSNKGISLDIPQSSLKGGSFLGNDPLGVASTPQPQPIEYNSQVRTANPFVGSQLQESSASDLVGLTPEMLGNIFRGSLDVENLKQKKVSEVADSLYKQKLMDQIDANIEEKTPVISIPGTDVKLTRDDYVKWFTTKSKDERTAAIQNYEYAVSKGYKGDFTSFQDINRTTNQKDYEAAVEGGYKGGFNQWLSQMKKAGATNINLDTKLAEKKGMSDIETRNYFAKGEHVADVAKHMEKADFMGVPGKGEEYKTNMAKAKSKEIIGFIESKIAGGRGTIKDVKWAADGKTMIWTVGWSDGETQEIRQRIK